MGAELDQSILGLAIFTPLVVACMYFAGVGSKRGLALLAFGVPAFASLWVLLRFEETGVAENGYRFVIEWEDTGLRKLGIALRLGLNGISLPLFTLAGIVGFAAGWQALNSKMADSRVSMGLLALMQAGLMGTFASFDVFFFYFAHELALIPTFVLIGLHGGRDGRGAAIEMTIYLTLGALLSLGGLIALYVSADVHSFDLATLSEHLRSEPLEKGLQLWIFPMLLFGFGILVALFPFHTWAPRGYQEAPTPVSMLHAGVLKKFGLYGLVQVASPLLSIGLEGFFDLLVWLALGNIVLVGLIALAQTRLKRLVGYSSVMHMGYCFLGIAVGTTMGVSAAVLLMTAHGLAVSLWFLLERYVHDRTGTSEMSKMGGLATKTPVLACLFLACILAAIGLPGFANFWGEFGVFLSMADHGGMEVALAFALAGVVISTIYGLRAIAKILFGEPSEALQEREKKKPIEDLSPTERIPAVILLTALLWIGIWPRIISGPIDDEVSRKFIDDVVSEEGGLR
ncbi:MAG: NADH-quinone oxidoreductase subunit N [Opitutales bacterium]|nr:NADH-quinone oxidoreductase subunit N [Opitutales bacterium]